MKELEGSGGYYYDYHTYQGKIAWDKSVRVKVRDADDYQLLREDFKRTLFVYKDISVKRHNVKKKNSYLHWTKTQVMGAAS